MPKRFIVGSVNGQFIGSMKKLAQEIFPLALNNQFQEPQIINSLSLDVEHQTEGKTQLNTNQNVERSVDFTYTSRPSDFRIKSIREAMTSEFVGHLAHNFDHNDYQQQQYINEETTKAATPKSIRKLFDHCIAEFNASIEQYVEIAVAHSLAGCVCVFYLSFHLLHQ